MTHTGPSRLITLTAVAAIAVCAIASPALGRDCFSADAPGPVLLPDGELYPAGEVQVCRERQISPVTTLHALSIDGRRVGFFLGKRQTVELDTRGVPTFLFARQDAGDQLELRAVAYSLGNDYHAFRAVRIGRGRKPLVRTSDPFSLAHGNTGGSLLAVSAYAD